MFWKRLATAAVLVPAAVATVLLAPLWLLAGVVGVISLLALWEFFRLGNQAGFEGFVQWTTLCSLLIIYAQWSQAVLAASDRRSLATSVAALGSLTRGIEAILILFVLGLAVIASSTRLDVSKRFPALLASAGGLVLLVFPLSYLIRITGFPDGRKVLLLVLVSIWVGDTSAFLVGRSFGRNLMAPALSPKKTWEGAAGNLLGSLVVGVVAVHFMGLPKWAVLVLVVLANVAGQAGDLLESAYKRSAGVKDSGVLLPGHGGMLDRIDSLVLAAPVAWWFLWLLLRAGVLR